MSRVLTIAQREIFSLFVTPIGYIVIFLFLVFMGAIFTNWILIPGQFADMRTFIDFSRFTLFFVVPGITMSLFSDEYRSGRMEMLRTSPITELELVIGKFLGAMGFYMLLILASLIFLAVLLVFGKPDFMQVAASYLGMTLMGVMFVSVGVFFSASSRDPIIALLTTTIVLGGLTSISYFLNNIMISWSFLGLTIPVREIASYFSVGTHIGNFARGVVDVSDIIYFAGIGGFFLFLTYLLLESRKWR